MNEFKLPDPGEGLLEADIVSWKVAVGDTVAVNDILLEIETAKSLVELPSPYAGVVLAILADEGATVEVGAPIIRIGRPDEASASVPSPSTSGAGPATPPAVAPASPASEALLVGYGAKSGTATRRPRKGQVADAPPAASVPAVAEPAPVAVPAAEPAPAPGAVAAVEPAAVPRAKPPVRRVARDLGVDLATVAPTGPGGTITADDVVAAAGGGSAPARAVSVPQDGERRVPLKGVRRQMFRSMTASLAVPQATAFVEVDVTATMQLIDTLKRRRDFTGLRVSPLAVFAKAACLAIERVPELNSRYDAASDEIVLPQDVNLGIAAATPRGLLVPNIKGANRMNLLELTRAVNDLVPLAREGKVPPAALSGGTFTITNIGVFGVDGGTPIPNEGEAAIMCLGTIRRKPWVVGTGEHERIEPRSVCTVTITFDHRLVDGEMGSKFLADVSTIMSDPALALLF